MAQENALSYRVTQNGSAGDWYWEVISDRKIIDRGLDPHEGASPRAGPEGCGIPRGSAARGFHATFRRSQGYRGTLKTMTPRSSTTEI
jgi:hypothetical protein